MLNRENFGKTLPIPDKKTDPLQPHADQLAKSRSFGKRTDNLNLDKTVNGQSAMGKTCDGFGRGKVFHTEQRKVDEFLD